MNKEILPIAVFSLPFSQRYSPTSDPASQFFEETTSKTFASHHFTDSYQISESLFVKLIKVSNHIVQHVKVALQ